MLDLDFIKDNTIWVIKYTSHRETGKYKELKSKLNNPEIKDFDIVAWHGQPKELQDFYKTYEYAIYKLNRTDLTNIDVFYEEWIKDPDQFKADHMPVIGQLYTALDVFDPCSDLIVENYDKHTIGNHKVGNFVEALQQLDCDFNVVKVCDDLYGFNGIIIQTDDQELIDKFSHVVNRIAIEHDRIMGDGKYYKD